MIGKISDKCKRVLVEDVRRRVSQRKQIIFNWQIGDRCMGMNDVMTGNSWTQSKLMDTVQAASSSKDQASGNNMHYRLSSVLMNNSDKCQFVSG